MSAATESRAGRRGRPATASEMVALTGAWRDGLAAAPAGVITAQSNKPHIPTNAARNRAIFPIKTPVLARCETTRNARPEDRAANCTRRSHLMISAAPAGTPVRSEYFVLIF